MLEGWVCGHSRWCLSTCAHVSLGHLVSQLDSWSFQWFCHLDSQLTPNFYPDEPHLPDPSYSAGWSTVCFCLPGFFSFASLKTLQNMITTPWKHLGLVTVTHCSFCDSVKWTAVGGTSVQVSLSRYCFWVGIFIGDKDKRCFGSWCDTLSSG